MVAKIIIFLLLTGLSYSQVSHYSALVKKRGGSSHVTDSAKLHYDYTDLTDGNIIDDEWVDNIYSFPFAGVLSDPSKSSSGVTFDGDDAVYNNTAVGDTLLTGGSWSIEVVGYFKTVAATQSVIIGVADGTEVFSIGFINGYFFARADSGVAVFAQWDSTNYVNEMMHITVTFGGGVLKCYKNGTLQTIDATTEVGGAPDPSIVTMGQSGGGGYLPNGSIIKYFWLFNKTLTQEEVTQNYNFYDSVIP